MISECNTTGDIVAYCDCITERVSYSNSFDWFVAILFFTWSQMHSQLVGWTTTWYSPHLIVVIELRKWHVAYPYSIWYNIPMPAFNGNPYWTGVRNSYQPMCINTRGWHVITDLSWQQ